MKFTFNYARATVRTLLPLFHSVEAPTHDEALAIAQSDLGADATVFPITPEPESITCPDCDRTSYSKGDIEHRYCGFCHKFHNPPS